MTLTQLKEDSKFLRLTEKQKAWTLAFCETGGDKLKAGYAGFNCRSDASAIAISYQQLKNPVIHLLVNEFVELVDTRITKDELLSKLGDRFRRSDDDEIILKIADRISKLEGWDIKPSGPPETPSGTGLDEVLALEKK